MGIIRCAWVSQDQEYIDYHDNEWGVPEYDDRKLFEMLNLEGAQAGLSWITVLKKRKNYLRLFDNFDPSKIIQYNDQIIADILQDPGIIRNKLKVNAVVTNAKAYFKVLEEFESFSDYIWQFVNHKPIVNRWESIDQIPTSTPESDEMSKDLKKRGFKFVGTTICYAYMQAVGMVNDHTLDCFRYEECKD